MMLMCRMTKPLCGSGKKVITVSVFFALKVLLLCLREIYTEMNRPRRMDIGEQKFMDMESMPIVK